MQIKPLHTLKAASALFLASFSVGSGNWMEGQYGIGFRINADNKELLENFQVTPFVESITDIPGVSYVIMNLSDPAYGDNYIAPHPILDAINDGLDPFTGQPNANYVDNPVDPSPTSGRDLFGELATAFDAAGVRVIAYMATQGPMAIKHGPSANTLYDWDLSLIHI